LDDVSTDGLALIEEIRDIYDNHGYETQILAASVIRCILKIEKLS
jgi:transaldolase